MIIGISGKMGSGKDLTGAILQYILGNKHHMSFQDFKKELPRLEPIQEDWTGDSFGDWKIKKFGTKLKQIVAIMIGCKVEDLENREFKHKPLGDEWNLYKVKAKYKGHYPEYQYFFDDIYADYYTEREKAEEMAELVLKRWPEEKITVEIEVCKMTPRKLLQLIGTECGREIIHPNVWVNALFSDYKETPRYIQKESSVSFYDKEFPNWIITDVRFPNEAKAIKDKGGIVIRVNRFCFDSAEDWMVVRQQDEVHTAAMNFMKLNPDLNGAEFNTEITKLAKDFGYVPLNEQHESETALDDCEFDYTIGNCGDIEFLYSCLKLIIENESKRIN